VAGDFVTPDVGTESPQGGAVTRIWGQALTHSERRIIERALDDGTQDELRRWLRFTLTVLDARDRIRAVEETP
jgi:hypothetical protein